MREVKWIPAQRTKAEYGPAMQWLRKSLEPYADSAFMRGALQEIFHRFDIPPKPFADLTDGEMVATLGHLWPWLIGEGVVLLHDGLNIKNVYDMEKCKPYGPVTGKTYECGFYNACPWCFMRKMVELQAQIKNAKTLVRYSFKLPDEYRDTGHSQIDIYKMGIDSHIKTIPQRVKMLYNILPAQPNVPNWYIHALVFAEGAITNPPRITLHQQSCNPEISAIDNPNIFDYVQFPFGILSDNPTRNFVDSMGSWLVVLHKKLPMQVFENDKKDNALYQPESFIKLPKQIADIPILTLNQATGQFLDPNDRLIGNQIASVLVKIDKMHVKYDAHGKIVCFAPDGKKSFTGESCSSCNEHEGYPAVCKTVYHIWFLGEFNRLFGFLLSTSYASTIMRGAVKDFAETVNSGTGTGAHIRIWVEPKSTPTSEGQTFFVPAIEVIECADDATMKICQEKRREITSIVAAWQKEIHQKDI